ncbi:hypothetical protein Bca52824_059774 [Brassica carinata]|uniref:Uncharacterized protein n=1 Tax=Brassica carinata TaxID=52824 RepID=A0A8X7QUW2_BRACI|nr:hypothetical protein Bca52824_059774 [Brassica carinata]
MSSSIRSNKDKHLLFSEDPAHLERTIDKDQRSTSLDAAAFTSTNSRTQPPTDTDLHRRSIYIIRHRRYYTAHIDRSSVANMVAIVILDRREWKPRMTRMVICECNRSETRRRGM